MKILQKLMGILLLSLALYGCGHDQSTPAGNAFPAGNTTLAFSAYSTATLPASISGIDLTITLPVGMSVATVNGLSGPITTESVKPGTLLAGTNLAYGSYSASTRKVYLSMATTSDKFRSGEFLRLNCIVEPNTSITLDDLRALNNPVVIKKAVGFDSVVNSTLNLAGELELLMNVVKGQ